MQRSPLFFFLSIAVFAYILAPRCVYFIYGKVTSEAQTLIITLLTTLVIFFLGMMLRKRSR